MNKEKQKPALSGVERVVPELRFPEFENNEEWKEKTLGNIAEIVTGTTPKTSESENYGGNKLFASPADISGKRYISETKKTLSEKGFSKSRVLPKNSVLFVCIGSTIGKIAQNKIECATNQQINSLIPFENHSNDFIYSLLEINSARIASLAGHQAVPLINKTDFSEILVLLPPTKAEQQKIANCLSLLDNLITAETEKLDHLKNHKKGLLQQLFPQAGETKPQFRFPEFEGDGEWGEKELSIALDGKASQIAKNKLELINKGFPVYGADGLIGFIDSFAQEDDYIAIVKDGSGVGNLFYCDGKSSLLGTLNYLISKSEEEYKLKWLYYLLQTISFKPFIKGSGIPHIYYKDYSKLLVLIPKDPEEQQKIANCLSSADDLIEEQTAKIEALKDHKKGLMQQLFPNANE